MDAETSLINMNARLYDPVIGRFVSADTVIQDLYNPQSLNRYSYVLNNPFRYIDPTGHALVGCWDGTCTFDNGGDSNASTTVYNQSTGAFFHTGNNGGYSITTGSGVFVESGSSALGYNSNRLWTNCVASECGSASESTWKVIDPNNPGLYGRALWYDESTGRSYWKITAALAHAGDDPWISVNGMLNDPDKATWLMPWHVHAEDSTMTRDTMLYSPNNGFLGGLGEAIMAKNGHSTPTSALIAQELQYGYEQGITHNWMLHSRGAPEFNQGAATAGVDLSYNNVWYHGGADHHADTNDLAAATGFNVMHFRDHPFDPVPQIAGRNGNIFNMGGSIPMLLCVLACSPANSPHTPPYMYGGEFPQRFGVR